MRRRSFLRVTGAGGVSTLLTGCTRTSGEQATTGASDDATETIATIEGATAGDESRTLTVGAYSSSIDIPSSSPDPWLKETFESEFDAMLEWRTPNSSMNHYIERGLRGVESGANLYVGFDAQMFVHVSQELDEMLSSPTEGLPRIDDVREGLNFNPQGRVVPCNTGYISPVYDGIYDDNNLITPEMLDGLLDFEYTGTLLTQGPTSSTAEQTFLLRTIDAKGEDSYLNCRTSLKENNIRVLGNQGDIHNTYSNREAPMVISHSTDQVFTAESDEGMARHQIRLLNDQTHASLGGMTPFADTSNSDLAIESMDFMFRSGVQAGIAIHSVQFPATTAVEPPEGFTQYAQESPETITLSYGRLRNNLNDQTGVWAHEFVSKRGEPVNRAPASVRRVAHALRQQLLILIAALTAVVLLILFHYPVATVFADVVLTNSWFIIEPIAAMLTSRFYPVDITWFAAKQAFYSTLVSLVLDLPAVRLFTHFEFRDRKTLRSLTILPFIMPFIMITIDSVATFGRNGTLNRALSLVGLPPVEPLLTLEAIVVVHTFYDIPLVARVVTAAREGMNTRTAETAHSFNTSPRRAFHDVVLLQPLSPIGVGAILTFVFAFASFPIVLALSGLQLTAIEVLVYSWVRGLAYAETASLTVVEMIILIMLTAAYPRYEANQCSASGAANLPPRQFALPADWTSESTLRAVGAGGYAFVVGLVFVVPVAGMALTSVIGGDDGLTLANYAFLTKRRATDVSFQVKPLPATLNSLDFATGAFVMAIPMNVTIAVLTAHRYHRRGLIDVFSMAPFIVSGTVVGFDLPRGPVSDVGVLDTRTRVTDTLAVIATHAVGVCPFVTRNVAPPFARLNGWFVKFIRSLGATRARVFVDVELPLIWTGVVAGVAFTVAISIGEPDSTIILAGGAGSYTMPIAVKRFPSRRLGPATAMGCLLLLVTPASLLIADRFDGRWGGP